jgi:hypothetical protein
MSPLKSGKTTSLNYRKTLPHKCRTTIRNSNLPTRHRTLPPLPQDFKIGDIEKHQCYRIWLLLPDGEILKRYGTTFKKGDDHSEQRLIRRIRSQMSSTRTKVSGKDSKNNNTMVFQCTEIPDEDDRTPISPPNIYLDKVFQTNDAVKSRIHYRNLFQKSKTKRKYVKGALYSQIMLSATEVFDVRRFKSSYNFEITTPQNSDTIVKVRNLSEYSDLLSAIITLNQSLPPNFSVCRNPTKTNDEGIMHVFGSRTQRMSYACMNKASSTNILKLVNSFVKFSKPILENQFPEEVKEIKMSDMTQDVDIHEAIGGNEHGVSAFISITRNLRNSSHYDDDNSKSIVIFTEKFPGSSSNWYFLFPNLVRNNIKDKAIAIKLFHGCAISFDATLLRHCTVFGSPGTKGNEMYGNLFGSKKFK